MAGFALEIAERDGLTVLRVIGSVDLTTAPDLRERLIELVTEGRLRIVVDLTDTDFLDSTGLGALVGALKRLRAKDGDLQLVCGPGAVRRVFAITSLDRVFAIHDTVDEALG